MTEFISGIPPAHIKITNLGMHLTCSECGQDLVLDFPSHPGLNEVKIDWINKHLHEMTDITENGKYYIPSIEEFHTGFEYELQVPEKRMWSKEVFHMNENHINFVRFVDIQDEHTHNKVRVKHLDHDDISACGWQDGCDINSQRITYHNGSRLLIFYPETKRVVITCPIGQGVREVGQEVPLYNVFDGSIKNKSELQRIMKQSAITE